MTKSDFVPMSQVLSLGRMVEGVSKLSGAAQQSSRDYGSNTGWQAILYPRANWLLFNVPVTATRFDQYGINTLTNAAFKFEGWDARCFGTAFGRLYMGGNGTVFLCDEGLKDGGTTIDVDVQQAFSALNDPMEKQVTAFAPVIQADGNVSLNTAIAYDYGSAAVRQTVSSESTSQGWDEITWPTWRWANENELRRTKYGASNTGRAVSLRLTAKLLGQQLKWYRTDYLYKSMRGF
jgi:hypothetical protein